MYQIIGADRREYGPVSADQILKWIAEGRANAQTRTRAVDSVDWKGLAEFPEFAAALAAKAPPSSLSAPPLIAGEQLRGGTAAAFGVGECFSRAWELYQSKFILSFGATAIILLLSIGLGSIHSIGAVVHAVLGFALWGGLQSLFLKLVRGQTADMGDAFAGFKASFVALMLGSLVAHVLTGVGFLLLILPGLYLLTAWWMFTPMLIIDRKLDFWPAMELSRKTVNRNWWPCFGLLLLSLLLAFAGALVCGIGLFFALPLPLLAISYAYEKLFGPRPESAATGSGPMEPGPASATESMPKSPSAATGAEVPKAEPRSASPPSTQGPTELSAEPTSPESPPIGTDTGDGPRTVG